MIPVVVIYQGPNPCTQCLGWKMVSSESKDSWKYWAELTPPSNLAVQMGLVTPIVCPRCQGSGVEPGLSVDLDVTDKVKVGDIDGENMYLSRCACGQEFQPWDFILHIYRENETQCPNCLRKLYFKANIQVFERITPT